MTEKIIEMDPNKVYSIIIEVQDMNKDEVMNHLKRVKSMYEEHGIKAIYSAMSYGVPFLTINEILPAIKEWQR